MMPMIAADLRSPQKKPPGQTCDDEVMADALEATGRYRVLRRLAPRPAKQADRGAGNRRGLFVDVETTGLDAEHDEIIELAMVYFDYGLDGKVVGVDAPFERLRQPSCAIPEAITSLTGISEQMVAGKVIDPREVDAFAGGADLVLAHNASFDRRFLERFSGIFARKPWACSMTQVGWKDEGFEGTKLSYLAMHAGFFYDRHRAANDCNAAIELLAASLPKSGRTGLSHLLQTARRPTWRIRAENAPFAAKDLLKRRGYRWRVADGSRPGAWQIDIAETVREEEVAFLRREIYRREVDLPVRKVTAYDRFSDRE